MVLNSKQHIPEVYSRERDMQVFTTLIDMILTSCKYDVDNLYRVYDAMVCPEEFLPKLGDTLNYKYDDANTVTSNRKILDVFMTMMKHKGSEIGLLMAAALCLTSLDISVRNLETADVNTDYINALKDLEIKYDYENAIIKIDYPNIYTQVRYLLDYVRPVGMMLELRSVSRTYNHIPLAILAQISADIGKYSMKKSEVKSAKVNFSFPVTQEKLDEWEDIYNQLVGLSDDNDTIDLNNG